MADTDSDDDLLAPGVAAAWGKKFAPKSTVPESAAKSAKVPQQHQQQQQKHQAQQCEELPRARSRSRSAARTGQLESGCKVCLHGLKGAAELNGQLGTVDVFLESSGRWRVKLESGQCKDLKKENLERCLQPSPGAKVRLYGLKGAAELNGQCGVVDIFIENNGRWRIKLESGQSKDLKAENLETLEPLKHVEANVAVGTSKQAEANGHQGGAVGQACDQSDDVMSTGHSDKYYQESKPGYYIVCDPGVRLNAGASLNDPLITVVTGGSRVEVVEVMNAFWSNRLRARIVQPAGWITLIDTSTGQRYALKDTEHLSTQGLAPAYRGEGVSLKAGESVGPGDRFMVTSFLGEGGFSTVWRCKDKVSQQEYALKFTRATEAKREALQREIQLMGLMKSKGAQLDPEGLQYLLGLVSDGFEHKGHLGVVFESMKYNVLTALERHGRGRGLPLLPAVRNFGKHMMLGLRALKHVSLVHSDIKPENLLVSKDGASIKLADFGNSMSIGEAESFVNDIFQPRFYRAPEVILGQKLGTPIDMWGAGATLYQIATDRFLFTGDTNNEVLHEMLAICGAFPHRMMNTGQFVRRHFDAAGKFLLQQDSSTVPMPNSSFDPAARPIQGALAVLLAQASPDVPQVRHDLLLGHFGELLAICLKLNPASRPSPQDALNHRFFAKGAGDPMADLAALWSNGGGPAPESCFG